MGKLSVKLKQIVSLHELVFVTYCINNRSRFLENIKPKVKYLSIKNLMFMYIVHINASVV
jgi:hypothetical protein